MCSVEQFLCPRTCESVSRVPATVSIAWTPQDSPRFQALFLAGHDDWTGARLAGGLLHDNHWSAPLLNSGHQVFGSAHCDVMEWDRPLQIWAPASKCSPDNRPAQSAAEEAIRTLATPEDFRAGAAHNRERERLKVEDRQTLRRRAYVAIGSADT